MKNEKNFYEKIGNWNFSDIKAISESQENWDMYEEISKYADEKSLILDLGTGGGEKVLTQMPKKVGMIIGTDLSPAMIKTARSNLQKYPNIKAKFTVMDNLKLEFPSDLFDIVVARHTKICAKEIHRILTNCGILIVRGVDKYDCWDLKELFGRGQAFNDKKAISEIDYEDIKSAGFKDIQRIKIPVNEYYETPDDLLKLLLKTPILDDFSEEDSSKNFHREKVEKELFDLYVKNNTYEKGILLKREYYGIVAKNRFQRHVPKNVIF